MTLHGRHFGYKPDPVDARDRLHTPPSGMTRITERRMDVLASAVRDQGQTSSCVGHACVEAVELLRALEGFGGVRLSPAHAYWLARAQQGWEHEDGGAYIRSCIAALRKVGCCGEGEWPLSLDTINTRPSLNAEMSGIRFADLSYERITGGAERVLDALQLGHPVVFGTLVGNVFVDARGEDTIPAPSKTEVFLGGHALTAEGFDRGGERVRVQNSWGSGWADKGFCWLAAEWFDAPTTSDIWALVPKVPS